MRTKHKLKSQQIILSTSARWPWKSPSKTASTSKPHQNFRSKKKKKYLFLGLKRGQAYEKVLLMLNISGSSYS